MQLASHAATRGRSIAFAVCVTALLLLGGCATGPRIVTPEPPPIPEGGDAVPENNEIVLSDGTQIVADAPWGRIKIEAGPGLRRVYTWRGNRRGVILEPRSERFAGSMGIRYEGQPPVWEAADGITKVDVEEGQRRFETVDDAMIWMQIRRLRYAYTNDGLVVGWKTKGDTLTVEVWQFYIDGEKPTTLPGADNTRVAVGPLEVVPQKMSPHLVFADGHTEPYNTETAAQHSGARAESKASTSTISCNWFQRTFTDCSERAEAAAKAKAQAEAEAKAQAEAAAAAQAERAAAAEAATPAEPEYPSATISGSTVNIRDGSSTNSKVLFQAKEGDSVEILKEDKGWRYVKFEDDRKGWVADFLLKK
ncbi:SH3 domain-containing protein [Salinisphaera sp.]|uniref:SH3 domain-containing protein n=1 Tax=Salinisphaera sp. TaxID=1914330 RepID=UPI0025E5B531|nr:SH3 domain-containing protein [Salinisphaera sp.]